MGLDLKQVRDHVVVPALTHIGFYSKAAERLVIATALAESDSLKYIKQLGRGPARGLFQLEPRTHDDIWDGYLNYRPELQSKLKGLMIPGLDPIQQLYGNHYYAASMCRIFYLRFPRALPDEDDLEGMAHYWKRYYNTHLGAGTVNGFIQKAHKVMKL